MSDSPVIERRPSWGNIPGELSYDELLEQLAEKNDRLAEAESAFTLLSRGSDKLREINEDLLAEHKQLQKELKESELDKAEYSTTMTRDRKILEETIANLSEEIATLQRSLAQAEELKHVEVIKSKKETEEAFDRKIKQLEARVKEEREKSVASIRQVDSLKLSLHSAETKAQASLAAAHELHAAKESEWRAKLKEAEALAVSKESEKAELLGLREQSAEYAAKIKDFNQILSGIKSEHSAAIAVLTAKLSQAESEVSQARFSSAEVAVLLSNANHSRDALAAELQALMTENECTAKKFRAHMDDVKAADSRVEAARRELTDERERVRRSESANLDLREKIASADERLRDAKTSVEASHNLEISTLNNKLEEQRELLSRAMKEKSDLLERMQKESKTSAETRDELAAKFMSSEVEKARLQVQTEELEKKLVSIKEDLAAVNKVKVDYADLQSKHRELLAVHAGTVKAKEEGEAAIEEVKVLKKKLSECDSGENTKLQQELQEVKEHHSSLLNQSRQKIKDMKHTVHSLQAKLSQAQQERQAIERVAWENKTKFEEKMGRNFQVLGQSGSVRSSSTSLGPRGSIIS